MSSTVAPQDAVLQAEPLVDNSSHENLDKGKNVVVAAEGGLHARKFSGSTAAGEDEPLLDGQRGGGDREQRWEGADEFAHLPWWKRPS
ncbi:hypothetical protein LTS18_009863, partial [Coniosporium uncinatum]